MYKRFVMSDTAANALDMAYRGEGSVSPFPQMKWAAKGLRMFVVEVRPLQCLEAGSHWCKCGKSFSEHKRTKTGEYLPCSRPKPSRSLKPNQ